MTFLAIFSPFFQIFVTELDFVSSSTSSRPLPLDNDWPVVQLSYFRQRLLVSTTDRAALADVSAQAIAEACAGAAGEEGEEEYDQDGKVKRRMLRARQVGARPRKRRGGYGAVFCKEDSAGGGGGAANVEMLVAR